MSIPEEKMGWLKAKFHERLVASLSFAEVVQIMNNMLVKEVDERVAKMSDEELEAAIHDLGINSEEKSDDGSESEGSDS